RSGGFGEIRNWPPRCACRSRCCLHFRSPFQESQQLAPVMPHKSAELPRGDSVRVEPPVGFNAPAQIRAAPGSKTIALARPPQESDHCLPSETVVFGISGVA